MFGKKTNTTPDFDDKLKAAKYDCILQALKDILKIEIKVTDNSGKEAINYAATIGSIKTRARIALDFVGNLDKSGDE